MSLEIVPVSFADAADFVGHAAPPASRAVTDQRLAFGGRLCRCHASSIDAERELFGGVR